MDWPSELAFKREDLLDLQRQGFIERANRRFARVVHMGPGEHPEKRQFHLGNIKSDLERIGSFDPRLTFNEAKWRAAGGEPIRFEQAPSDASEAHPIGP